MVEGLLSTGPTPSSLGKLGLTPLISNNSVCSTALVAKVNKKL